MEDSRLISIVIGSYNGADFLNETVDSILAQTYKNIELILVDDGSKDQTLEIMYHYEHIDARVHVFHQENSGASAARERGYRASSGDYIVLSDDDDVWSPYLLEDVMRISDSYPDAEVVTTFNRRVNDFAEISNYNWEENLSKDILGKPQIMSGHDFGLRYRCNTDVRPGFFWGMLFKKAFMDQMVEAFMKVKEKMPTHYFNDSFCASRVSGMAKKIVVTNQIHILYRVCAMSLSHKSTVSLHVKHYVYALEEELDYYRTLGWEDVYNAVLPGGYLVVLRSWFMVYAHEKNERERGDYFAEIHRLYDKYISDLKRIPKKGCKDWGIYWSILFWKKCPKTWFRLIRILRGW
ncbi:MAG: glycosyltransferase family 2 protein [Lachnospiraceae bacterium]|jgi:glycosyltransferase involved in cell wall biosynthesis|nr:glycosyltransferase family 2 protein [Lachnospiraceae bacterium]